MIAAFAYRILDLLHFRTCLQPSFDCCQVIAISAWAESKVRQAVSFVGFNSSGGNAQKCGEFKFDSQLSGRDTGLGRRSW